MKKTTAILAAAAMTAVVATAAGCAATGKNYAPLASNWYYDSAISGIQPSFTGETCAEKFSYAVKQTDEGGNASYSVKYADGTYDTVFYAQQLTAADIDSLIFEESWRESYKQQLGKDGYMYVYHFTTELTIPSVTFTLKSTGETHTGGEEHITTDSYFLAVNDYLAPIYTKKTVKSLVPAEWQASSLASCFKSMDRTYTSCYSLYGGSVSTDVEGTLDGGDSAAHYSRGLDSNNSVFDSAYLPIVARAMKNISGSMTITLYTAGDTPKNYTLSGSSVTLSEAEQNSVRRLLADNGLFTEGTKQNSDGTTAEKTVGAVSVSAAYNGGDFSGVSQKYVFAVTDEGNKARTVMVKFYQPLDFGLGGLEYLLTDIKQMPVL